jgi:hypothetical protein
LKGLFHETPDFIDLNEGGGEGGIRTRGSSPHLKYAFFLRFLIVLNTLDSLER